MQKAFDKEQFYKTDSGCILNSDVERFVAGWFGDIAYKRGYIKADKNKDGFMSEEEQINTKSWFGKTGIFDIDKDEISKITRFHTTGSDTYLNYVQNDTGLTVKNHEYTSDTIEAELNKTIKNDVNLDGKISLSEIYDDAKTKEYVEKNIKKAWQHSAHKYKIVVKGSQNLRENLKKVEILKVKLHKDDESNIELLFKKRMTS